MLIRTNTKYQAQRHWHKDEWWGIGSLCLRVKEAKEEANQWRTSNNTMHIPMRIIRVVTEEFMEETL